MVERHKVRDGVFVREIISLDQKDFNSPDAPKLIEEMFKGCTPDGILEEIETELNEAQFDPESSDSRKHDIKQASFRLELVKKNLADNAAHDLLFNFYLLMNFLWRAKVRPFEGGIFFKTNLMGLNKKGNQARIEAAENKQRVWQDMADEIRAESRWKRSWGKSRIAVEIHRRLQNEDSELIAEADTIRRKIT